LKKCRSKCTLIIGIIFMTASLCFVLYPSASNAVNSFFAASTINNYAANLDSISAADRSQYLSAAAEYNNNLSELVNGFTYDVDSVIDGYDDILNFGDGLIGYIDISKINVKLPIYHGDEDKVLEKGVAHLPNTAFPIGGVGNHSVLSAHTGYPTQVFFDNLNELEIGDEIKVSVLDETLTYAVTAKNIVKPDNISLLSVDEEKDLLSLITCYPYGVNSHRLIVTAERVSETASPDTAIKAETNNRSFDFILLAIIAIAITAVIATFAVRKRRKNNA
jgi:sortase A